jgi:poly(3-hydroxybutyrate) depolymerase
VALATRLAFWIGGTRGRQLREITGQLYREIASDPVATQVGSVLGLARRELLQRSFNVGHYYSYVPEHAPGERPGLIVFLHGNGGNFQILPWAWRPFAECERFAVIAPTFGFGFWGKGGVAAVERAMGDARDWLPIDPGRVYLAGISDSGKGATRSAAAHPTRFRAADLSLADDGSQGTDRPIIRRALAGPSSLRRPGWARLERAPVLRSIRPSSGSRRRAVG